MNRKQQTSFLLASLSVVAAVVALLLFTPASSNLWLLATKRGFTLPDESSIFTFRVTELSAERWEWWSYAEDGDYFYARGQRDGLYYIAYPRLKVTECSTFQPRDWRTWCEQFQILNEST